ncbi:hypothetical protein NPX13_g8131 [Xylaria arbuscula]|uniref:Anti-silencing function protein 1 n=1 Tax=Xylaria arbuscula TaxID=114810 RepID=A0A9W8N9B7_9PEZI|nr:hypothetical protein NPX13_g8131 [Xylaria arbuscula]
MKTQLREASIARALPTAPQDVASRSRTPATGASDTSDAYPALLSCSSCAAATTKRGRGMASASCQSDPSSLPRLVVNKTNLPISNKNITSLTLHAHRSLSTAPRLDSIVEFSSARKPPIYLLLDSLPVLYPTESPKMSVVSLLGVNILNNPAKFTDNYELEITFECLEQLEKDLEWKLTYVGSATSDQYDQELDSLLVGPIPVGVNKFIFEADAPKTTRIPDADILGVTVILLTCSYDGREFVRVGYYVNNEYDSDELNADPPAKPIIEKIRRNVLAEKPRVTRFAIKWDSEASAPAEFPPEQPEADLQADEEEYGAEELDEDVEEEADGVADKAGETSAVAADGDAEMGGAGETGEIGGEDEMSEDGSVDLENESEDELEEDVEGEAGAQGDVAEAGDDAMEVDDNMPDAPNQKGVAAH